MSYLKDFRARIAENDYPGFLKIWEEYCYNDEPDGPELKIILEEMKASDLAVHFGNHVERALSQWRELKDPVMAQEILKLIVDIQTTNTIELYEIVYRYLQETYANDPHFHDKIRIIGMRSRRNYQGAISHYELLTHMAKGKFVFHTAGWGTCEIVDLSLIREEVILECDFVIGQKHISFVNACKNLIPLSDDHFLARRFGNPDAFEEESKKNPLTTIHLLLKDLGPKSASEIKDELCDLVIPESDWNRWWQTARSKIKKDTKIASPSSSKGAFRLRDEEVSHETIFQKQLEKMPPVGDLIQIVYSFLRDFPETLKNAEFKSSLQSKVEAVIAEEELTDAQKLQLFFILDDLKDGKSKEAKEFLINAKDIGALLKEVDIVSFKKKGLQILRKNYEGWKDLFGELLFSIGQYLLQDYIVSQLEKVDQGTFLKEKIQELLKHPISYPEVFVWYFQKILPKSSLPYADDKGRPLFFEGFLILLDHVDSKPDMRDLTKKMINILLAGRYKVVRDVFKTSSLDQVKEFTLLATKCSSLTDHDISIIHSLAEVVYPSLRKAGASAPEETIIWTTNEGFVKTKNRLEQIATVETVENAKEIEAARALGDLRENAEFKAALEKRDRLQSEMKTLSSQLNNARILNPSDIDTKRVGVGVIVHCKDSKGKKMKFTLLGPWDANPEQHILSFQSKLAKVMDGKSVGETFTFQDEEFTITSIENYFDQK